jgi:hypothetical protein
MRVKLCARCPYTPQDLTGHFDPEAALHVCAKCGGEQGMPIAHYPRKAHRRRKCSTVPNIFGMAQRSVAPSVTESLVSSGTTAGEPPSVQRSALLAARPARRATADGYAGFKLPGQQLQNREEEPEPSVSSLMPASVKEEPI